jgi:signal peptidase I
LPGERLGIQSGRIYINEKLLDAPEFPIERQYFNAEGGFYGKSGKTVQIPQDSYFVLGDNSSMSQDSRNFGFIPRSAIKSKAFFTWWPPQRRGKLK